ncbi:MAG TPA: metal-dependent hydrolase [Gemmatimonadales bacterium]|jgi:inner membrane protein|nr:metal-dependent hydrolase [Gemmatimonadales bacterium]
MASALTHGAVAVALGACFDRTRVPSRALVAGGALALVPDLDAIGFWLGVPTRSVVGHRGLTHSLFFATVVGLAAAWAYVSRVRPAPNPWWLGLFFVLVLASHGLLDALTNGGPGIAFFSPFSSRRYFFPFRPIEVSPISIGGSFNARGLRILVSELRWVWLPAGLLAGCGILVRRARRRCGPGAA